MTTAIRLLVTVATGCIAACASPTPASAPGATKPPPVTVAPVTATTTTPTCVGLSICPPPPPDAEGNPGCYYSDGWRDASGGGIEVWYFHEPQNISKADKITALVRKKDGTSESQDANIEAGQQVHRFEFATIDKSAVQEVLLTTSGGRCYVAGPGA